MFYTPKFCNNCGEKIERAEKSWTDSGRFCDVCKHDYVLKERLPQIFVVLMALVGVFGIGSYWRGGEKPVSVASKQFTAANASKTTVNAAPQSNSNSGAPQNNVRTNAINAPTPAAKTPSKQTESAPLSDQPTYFCGAPTKKGSPCSRRVKGGGRCWQHQGQNAMLPPEKLQASK